MNNFAAKIVLFLLLIMPSISMAQNTQGVGAAKDNRGSKAVLGANNNALAQRTNRNLYTITGVRVDETANSSVEARKKALRIGQEQAYNLLIERIVTDESRSSVPVLNSSSINRLVRSLEIHQEKITSTRYLATLTVHFNTNAVRTLLRVNKVTYVDKVSPLQLLIPMIIGDKGLVLAPRNHPWIKSWQTANKEGFVPLFVPNNIDLRQKDARFSPRIFLNQDQLAINALAKQFNASGALGAVLLPDDGKGASVAYVIGSSSSGNTDFRVAVLRSDLDKTRVTSPVSKNEAEIADSLVVASEILTSEIVRRLNLEWRKASATNAQVRGDFYQVGLRFDSFGSWDNLRNSITAFPGLSDFNLLGITPNSSVVTFRYTAGFSRLRSLFARQSLILEEVENDEEPFWIARRPGTRNLKTVQNR